MNIREIVCGSSGSILPTDSPAPADATLMMTMITNATPTKTEAGRSQGAALLAATLHGETRSSPSFIFMSEKW